MTPKSWSTLFLHELLVNEKKGGKKKVFFLATKIKGMMIYDIFPSDWDLNEFLAIISKLKCFKDATQN